MSEPALIAIRRELDAAQKILLLTHVRPDGDALASSFALRQFFREQGKAAEVFLPESVPHRYRELCPGALSVEDFGAVTDFDRVLLLDCAAVGRIGFLPELGTIPPEKLLNIDHHRNSDVVAAHSWVDPEASSCAELAAKLAMSYDRPLSVAVATLLLLGMITDTGGFRFSNTSGAAMRVAAQLLDAGAELEKLVNAVYFSNPLNQLELQADIIENHLKFSCAGKFVYTYLAPELLQKHHFSLKESENLIDLLRSIDSVVVAALIYTSGGNFKISLRSKDSAYPILDIARHFNGGGHLLAGGATIAAANFAEVEKLLVTEVEKLFARGAENHP